MKYRNLHQVLNSTRKLILISVFAFIISYTIKAQNLHFAFLTDLHVSPGIDNEKALIDCIDEINSKNLDFVVVTGDLSNTGSNAELLAVKAALDKLNKPLLIIPGNHETNWSESAGLLFNKLWGNDRFVFHKNGFLLVGFNTGPFMKMGEGHVKQEDVLWLSKTLKEFPDEKLISFSHYPIADGLDNWSEILQVLNENNCLIDFCGHGHQLSLLNFNNLPGIMGRSLKDKKGFGYNVVEINGNKILVTEQLLDKNLLPQTISLDLSSHNQIKDLATSSPPDYSINSCSKATIDFEYNDTVSIFSGLCTAGDSMLIYGNSIGLVKAIKIKDRKVLWQNMSVGPIYSTPVIVSKKVVFGTADGNIKALDLKNGKELWKIHVGRPVLSEALVEKNTIYIGGGDKAFFKIDTETGSITWKFEEIKGPIQGKPALSGNNIVFGAWDTNLYCLDTKTGNLNWKWSNGKSQTLLSPGNIVPAISRKKVFIVAPDRYFTALDLKTGKEIWRTNKHRVRESMGISPNGKQVYAKLMNDSAIAVSAISKEFKTLWTVNASTGYEHNPCPVTSNNKMVLIGTKNGLIVAMDPRTGSIIWKFKVGNTSINNLVINQRGTVWLTTTEGKIISLTNKL